MVDFKKLKEASQKPLPVHPRDIFNSLPKPPGINDLYASQAEVLDAWFDRKSESDLVVKLHTGGGKTLVALLIAQSVMNEIAKPVLYLAPNNQLVQQVLKKSYEYGIPATSYTKGEEFPEEFYNGKSVLVGAYETLFNGKSRFGIHRAGSDYIRLGAIILDDAHAALSSVRKSFTLEVNQKDHKNCYDELAKLFRPDFRDVQLAGTFRDILSGKELGILEVPVWSWLRNISIVEQIINLHSDKLGLFVWPFLRDNLNLCHCLISSKCVTITPVFPLVNLLPSFEQCSQRIYMSATIADDSEVIRTFDAPYEAISKPITSTSLAGVGERMILIPQLMKLNNEPITPLVKSLVKAQAKKKRGSVVLVPSELATKQWADVALYPGTPDAVTSAVSNLQDKKSFDPIVLANRYDGIDLPGDACRLLVVDDLPQGISDYDRFRASMLSESAISTLLAQRIEQGIGRGARGGADYCVVILVGTRLVAWIGRRISQESLTASTKVQLRLGREVSKSVKSPQDFIDTLNQCLERDKDWIRYHAAELAEAAKLPPVNLASLRQAQIERKAFKALRLGQTERAITKLQSLVSGAKPNADAFQAAWSWASAARAAFIGGDEAKGHEFIARAYDLNPQATPPKIRPTYAIRPTPTDQSESIVSQMLAYEIRAAWLSDLDDQLIDLQPAASASQYEQALENLGRLLGFDAERPEKKHGKGPDILWRTPADFDFLIEAKSKKIDNPLYKSDHAQLLEAEAWYHSVYPKRKCVRVSALPAPVADPKATPSGSFALTLANITALAAELRNLMADLIDAQGQKPQIIERCEAALSNRGLTAEGIRKKYLVPFNV